MTAHIPKLSELADRIAGFDPDAVTVEQARAIAGQLAIAVAELETVALRDALGRVLAAEVISPLDVPAHDNAAMDGYAFDGAAIGAGSLSLQIAGTALAGHPYADKVATGSCVRIMTGAPIPAGCDTVAPREIVTVEGSTIVLAAGAIRRHANVRLRGEDLRAGAVALAAGRLLRPADIGLLASLGISEVAVRRRLRVALFSTGDELRSIGQAAAPGSIYDSNRHTLRALLLRLGCEVLDRDPVADDPAALEAALRSAAAQADAIITSGGAAAGAADHTRQAAHKLGDIVSWNLALRPGRPLTLGVLDLDDRRVPLFGLPGNPVAAMVAFIAIAREVLLRMTGAEQAPLPLMQAACAATIRKKPGRAEYQRGIVFREGGGAPQVRPTGDQGSGILRSMSEANCLIVLAAGQGDVKPGEPVDVLLFDGLM